MWVSQVRTNESSSSFKHLTELTTSLSLSLPFLRCAIFRSPSPPLSIQNATALIPALDLHFKGPAPFLSMKFLRSFSILLVVSLTLLIFVGIVLGGGILGLGVAGWVRPPLHKELFVQNSIHSVLKEESDLYLFTSSGSPSISVLSTTLDSSTYQIIFGRKRMMNRFELIFISSSSSVSREQSNVNSRTEGTETLNKKIYPTFLLSCEPNMVTTSTLNPSGRSCN